MRFYLCTFMCLAQVLTKFCCPKYHTYCLAEFISDRTKVGSISITHTVKNIALVL
jgi:hypothetical protein